MRSLAFSVRGSPYGSPGLSSVAARCLTVSRIREELSFVSRAELAYEEVEAYADPHPRGTERVHRLRDQSCHVLAGKHQDPFPVFLWNQLISRHRRSCIRARWRITQRLVSETFKTLQISPVSAPSISRRVKALAWFGDSPERHFVN